MQGTLSNIAAGVMPIFFRPFRTGQYIEVAGTAGTVKNVSLFTTELATAGQRPDHFAQQAGLERLDGQLFASPHPARVDFLPGISCSDNIDKAFFRSSTASSRTSSSS
ncbi:mechanosensitive ion channel domain-containing protein [Chlorobaculum sp. 24CR]|uniref:mechanosensitive ion channel domain-containing protein n=1 Tax=Chlorobaculum sp. 24CR TaxID=2508878 RepID=UPI00142F7EC7|nr:mechanosensitive ion channel domain-containing protein [Chlorobaculum sp. 24CR]